MQLPPFMSMNRIANLCDWPTADRRKLVSELRLTGADGTEINHHDETAFWNAIMPYFSNPAAYQTLSSHLKQISDKAARRRLDLKIFQHLAAKAKIGSSFLSNRDDGDLLSRVAAHAAECQAFDELADWLWVAWLVGFPPQSITAIIDNHEPLRAFFGDWRPPIDAVRDEIPMGESEQVPAEPETVNHIGALFRKARESIDEAERLQAHEPLATALVAIEELASHLRSRINEEQLLQSALAEFCAVRDRLHAREQPSDRQAAERLQKVIARLAGPSPRTPYVEVKDSAEKIGRLVDEADAARTAWRTCDAAYRESPFDHEIRRAWMSALEAYEQAEGNLAGFLERVVREAEAEVSEGDAGASEAEAEVSEAEAEVSEAEAEVSEAEAEVTEAEAEVSEAEEEVSEAEAEVSEVDVGASEAEAEVSEADGGASEGEAGAREGSVIAEGGEDSEESRPTAGSEAAEQLAATFMERGDIGLFEIACSAGRGLNYHLPHPMLARLLGLSGAQDAETQLRVTEALQAVPATVANGPTHQGETWLRLAGLSLPAVTDPTLLCRTALAQLKLDQVVELKSLQAAIVALGRTYPALEAFAQTSAPEAEQEFRDAKEDLRRYVVSLKGSTLAYAAATVVAHKLAHAFEKIATTQPLEPNAVEGMIDAVMRTEEIDDAVIRRHDKEARGATAERRPIEARALTRLREIVKEIRTRAARLKRAAELLREERGSNARTIEATHRKGRDLHRHFQSSAEALERLGKVEPGVSAFSAACAGVAARLLREHMQAFASGSAFNPFRQALERDRFRLPSMARRPDLTPEATWEALRELALQPAMNWLKAFDVALDRREHLATEALLPLATPLANGRSLDAERDEAIAAARNFVETERAKLRDDLLTVMNYAPAVETSLDALYQGVAQIDAKDLPRSDANLATAIDGRAILDFPDALAEISTAKENVRRVRTSALKELEDRIAKLEKTAPVDTVASLRRLVENDELITLAEELSLVERGQDIKIATPGPLAIEDFSRFLTSHAATNPELAAWEHAQNFPHGSRSKTLIRKWLNLRTAQGDQLNRAIRDVLGELGFIPEGEAHAVLGGSLGGGRVRQFSSKVRTIADREFCSVARFGSEAEGQYKIVMTSQDARPNEIVTSVSEGDAGATLVFAQKWLTPDERRAIAAEARRLGRSFCLVDDGLMAFLCTKQHVLRELFACGIRSRRRHLTSRRRAVFQWKRSSAAMPSWKKFGGAMAAVSSMAAASWGNPCFSIILRNAAAF